MPRENLCFHLMLKAIEGALLCGGLDAHEVTLVRGSTFFAMLPWAATTCHMQLQQQAHSVNVP